MHRRAGSTSVAGGGWQRLLYGDAMERITRGAERGPGSGNRPRPKRAESKHPDLSAYEGLASWVDIFNHGPWANPRKAVRKMAKRGAQTIFLQTSTYGQRKSLYDRESIDEYLVHAHRKGMKVVAWYVPTFNQQNIDFERSKRAIRYRSPSGHRFDSFGLDIEATHVGNIKLRNQRLIALSERLRRVAGPSYPLSAITPDPVIASYWPNFPYKKVGRIFDVIVPMGYWTFRASGFKQVRRYTSKGVKNIRRATGKKDVPIHFIGGIADDARPSDLRGFTKAAREHELIGASLYDYPITDRRSWYEMRALSRDVVRKRRREAAAEKDAEAERQRRARKKRREERTKARDKTKKRARNHGDAKAGSKKAKGSKKNDRSPTKRSKAKKDRSSDSKRTSDKRAKELRNSSSSASRPGSTSEPTDVRERLRLRSRVLSFQRF